MRFKKYLLTNFPILCERNKWCKFQCFEEKDIKIKTINFELVDVVPQKSGRSSVNFKTQKAVSKEFFLKSFWLPVKHLVLEMHFSSDINGMKIIRNNILINFVLR